ncbi:MAG: phosphoribosylanthranilate isomerase [Verrucomicrobia bacterium]|nr:phosphoribosylanthranilate isomerase [Verrucomicrobiota bacterium]
MSVKVKICGLTRVADARAAVAAGADMIGLMFYPGSPRAISLAQAAAIAAALSPEVIPVGVFVNPASALVKEAIAAGALKALQFHGDEPPDFCTQFGLMSIKAFRVRDANSLRVLPEYPTDAWLLDAYTPGSRGGTGEMFNWDLARAAQVHGRPLFLAGGLTPDNVAAAVRRVRPFAVDVSSGVESAPGLKDAEKIRAFVRAAKSASASAE